MPRTRRVTEMRSQSYAPSGGTERVVEVPVEVEQPVVPRDWDAITLTGVLIAVLILVAGAMTWSTVSIGSTLALIAPSWVSYMIAAIFDAAWVICLALEWLARFDPDRAQAPRNIGWVALAISMAAIATHGYLSGYLIVGIFGAVVSAIAKGLWALVMRQTAQRLSPVQQAWVTSEMSDIAATRSMIAARRAMARTNHRVALEASALSFMTPSVDVVTQEAGPDPALAKKLKKVKRDRAALRQQLEEARRSAPEPPAAPPLVSGGSGASSAVPMTQLVKTLLADGVDPNLVVERVLQMRPEAPPDSVRRTLSTVLRNGGYM